MKIGILGGGQLARMLAIAGIQMGYRFKFLVNSLDNQVNDLGEVIVGDLDNKSILELFAKNTSVITLENENIPTTTLDYLEEFTSVYPRSNALACFQDRLIEKNTFTRLGIPTNKYLEVNTREDLENAVSTLGLPFILKKRRNGYDGKHQIKVSSLEDLNLTSEQYTNCIAEEFIKFDSEISVIGISNVSGDIKFYDICQNTHVNGILHKTKNIPNHENFNLASNYLTKIIKDLNYTGVIALELFQKDNKLFANEVAPRVHNSGHWTIEGSCVSQFQNHLRAILDLPLGNPKSICSVTMTNIIGEMPQIQQIFIDEPSATIHDYNKEPRPGRKLGHITSFE